LLSGEHASIVETHTTDGDEAGTHARYVIR
jgi:hypothetical protein